MKQIMIEGKQVQLSDTGRSRQKQAKFAARLFMQQLPSFPNGATVFLQVYEETPESDQVKKNQRQLKREIRAQQLALQRTPEAMLAALGGRLPRQSPIAQQVFAAPPQPAAPDLLQQVVNALGKIAGRLDALEDTITAPHSTPTPAPSH